MTLASLLTPSARWAYHADRLRRVAERPKAVETHIAPRFKFRGAAARLQHCDDPEFIIGGPAETGKTYATLQRVDNLARTYPKAQGAILRKVQKDLWATTVKAFRELFERDGVTHYGGEKPEWFDYPNGSRVWVGGLDRPGAFLSGQLDFAYCNQVEEFSLADWETLSTRTTGRAANMPFGQLFGDCNPGSQYHWIKQRADLTFMESRHGDNPALYDDGGNLTSQGIKTMATLARLTGVRAKRLGQGLWVSAEGTVYEFDPAIHRLEYNSPAFPHEAIPAEWRRIRAIDFGYTNPFSCSWYAVDGDGRMYLYRQIYMTGRTVRAHSAQINALSEGERYEATVADHDAEDRATLEENGIYSSPADKAITVGIEKVQERLKLAGDGKPRLFVMADALVERDEALAEARQPINTEQEFDMYVYPKAADGKPIKEVPVDMFNHGLDELRYAVMYLDAAGGSWFVDDPK